MRMLAPALVVFVFFGAASATAAPTPIEQTTPLHDAVHQKDVTKATALVRAGADVNRVTRYGVTPLSLAAGNGDAALINLLLEAGADVGKADAALTDGRTVLMLAARTGSVDAIRLLLAHGANVNGAERRMGTTALMWAAVDDRGAAIRVLAQAGADVNARSALTSYPHTPPGVIGDPLEDGYSYVGQTVLPRGHWTALMYAARQGATSAARALAEAGADLNAVDPDGTPALTFAIINGHYEVAAMLVERGADVNLADRTGATPLYSAVDMHTLASSSCRT
jgi:ankyrin repeat protein